MNREKRVLVTGGAGFIGSHLVATLVKQQKAVVVVDNLTHGDRRRVPNEANLIVKDIRAADLSKVFERWKPEIVYHLAAQQDVAAANKNPLMDAEINILGTLNVLECCRRTGVKRIIYADSVAGFGEPEALPIGAAHPRKPKSCYGISKHTGEHYLGVYQANFGLEFTGLVLANVYGPRQDPWGEGGVVAIFAQRMVNREPVTIDGSGGQTRDFIFVKDVTEAMLKTAARAANRFLMVGSGQETSVNQLFHLLAKMTGYTKKPAYGPCRAGDVMRSVFTTEETEKLLNWQPKYSLNQGLAETVAFFKQVDSREEQF